MARRLLVGAQGMFQQLPVRRADLIPAGVGTEVKLGGRLREPRHGRLGLDLRHVGGREPVEAIRPLGRIVTFESRQPRFVGVNRSPCRRDERVVPALLGDGLGNVAKVAEVAGELVLRAHVIDEILNLDDIAGAEGVEADNLRSAVVVQAVPGLGKILVPTVGGFEYGNSTVRASRRKTRARRMSTSSVAGL